MVGVAIVGLGMGRNRAMQVKETEGAELKVVVDLNTELAEKIGNEMGCDWTPNLADALGRSDVDVVFILTPSGLHAKLGVEAARAGKHVITTKTDGCFYRSVRQTHRCGRGGKEFSSASITRAGMWTTISGWRRRFGRGGWASRYSAKLASNGFARRNISRSATAGAAPGPWTAEVRWPTRGPT